MERNPNTRERKENKLYDRFLLLSLQQSFFFSLIYFRSKLDVFLRLLYYYEQLKIANGLLSLHLVAREAN
jgi:hypothetical protein